MKINLTMFDMDGVLIDSRKSMEVGWNNISTKHSLNINFKDYLNKIGKPFNTILEELGIDENLHAQLRSEYGLIVNKELKYIRTYRGIKRVLRWIKSNNLKIAVVTSKDFWRADILIDKLELPIDILITPEQTINGKPSGEPLQKAIDNSHFNKDNCIYIGDMKSDYLAAIDCGVRYFHASWGYGKPTIREKVFDYPEEIIEYIKAINY